MKDIYNIVPSFEKLKTKFEKVTSDIKSIKICKRGLIPTFANVRLSIKQQNHKLKRCVSRIFMENELQTKHREKHNLKKDIKAISYQLRRLLPTLVYATVLHQVNLAVRSEVKSIVKRHEPKVIKFRRQYHTQLDASHLKVNKHIHNFSLYVLSSEKITALSVYQTRSTYSL